MTETRMLIDIRHIDETYERAHIIFVVSQLSGNAMKKLF